jgi:hypothetical protein
MKKIYLVISTLAVVLASATSCQKFETLEANPNAASEASIVPPSYLLGRLFFELYQGGGVTDGVSGRAFEGPFNTVHVWNQFIVSNDIYYGIGNNSDGSNAYSWSNTTYNWLKLISKMELQAAKSLNPDLNAYKAMGKFLRAYAYVWLTQRVGDIPTKEAGLGLENLAPAYTSQKDVYAQVLQLLEEANADLTTIIPTVNASTNISGDIYFNSDLKKWQKVINAYKLRVLISLSKRADDTPELGIKQKFADVINNPAKYPVLTSNSDNLQFVFNQQYNSYPLNPTAYYNKNTNMGVPIISVLSANLDPRIFVISTPAPAQTKAGKLPSDFTAYVGANNGLSMPDLKKKGADGSDIAAGPYSYISFLRYYQSFVGPENYILIGYPELCFNIAEAANRGWITVDAGSNYLKGINASLSLFGLTAEGVKVKVADAAGSNPVEVTTSINAFLAKAAYAGNNAAGLKQIVEQKYVAFFQNSGWEAFFNWRRTGYPSTFVTTGAGINAASRIPMRWAYPVDETTYNSANASAAILSQYGSEGDNINSVMWLIK